MPNLPEHLSYSQYNSYTQCPRSWYLGKVQHAQERMTWFLPIGTAVHTMIEDTLAGEIDSLSAERIFYPLVEEQLLIEPDMDQWLAGGPKGRPVVKELALQKVKDCYERALEFLDDIDVWEVEYDASGSLPGLEVPLKAYVDIIGEYKGKIKKAHGPVIVDWKTGKNKPKSAFQLETYQARLIHGDPEFSGVDWRGGVKSGLWAMLDPDASVARPFDLSAVDPAEVGAKYQKVYDGMKTMQIQAEKQFGCRYCFQQDNCMEYSGVTNRTIHYDRSRYDQPPY